MKRTPDDHPDYVNLKLATEQMVKAGASVNEKKREQEECEKKERQDELGKKWYFVTKIVLTYCEKKLF